MRLVTDACEALPPEHADLAAPLGYALLRRLPLTGLLETLPKFDTGAAGPAPRFGRPGTRVGPYELLRELGAGGMRWYGTLDAPTVPTSAASP